MNHLYFLRPELLWVLPFALLPFLRYGVKVHSLPSLVDWPRDFTSTIMDWGIRSLAVLVLASLLIAAASPFSEGGTTSRVGKGAEIVVVLDRSGSMSEGLKGREFNRQAAEAGESDEHFLSKIEAARKVLLKFMRLRPADSFGMVVFNAAPISVAPISNDRDLPEAALRSAQSQSTGFTALSRALAMGLDYFKDRPYTATRLILLVSDGDALIEPDDQIALKAMFRQQRAELMWIYVRGERELTLHDTVISGPTEIETDIEQTIVDKKQVTGMHQVFTQLGVPYQAFEVESEIGLQNAIATIARATNKLTRYEYRLPRRDWAGEGYFLAILMLVILWVLKQREIESWKGRNDKNSRKN